MTTTKRPTRARRKRCSECGELKDADEVLGQQRLCEACEEDKDYCTICDWWYSGWGDSCRHIQWCNEHGCLCGCGSNHLGADAHRESFAVVLSKLSPLTHYSYRHSETLPLLPSIREAIASTQFWTQWHGPLIGGPPDLALRRGDGHIRDIYAHEQLDWGDDAIEAMQLGMSWLTSLDSETKAANALTVKWIDAFCSSAP